MAVAIVIIVILVVAVVTIVVLAGTGSARSTGSLSRETRSRDAGAGAAAEATELSTSTELEATGRERADETRATLRERARRRAARGDVVEYEPVDEEELGVTRRQFLNRGLLGRRSASRLAGLRRRDASAFLWPHGLGGLRRQDRRGKIERHHRLHRRRNAAPFYVPEARARTCSVPDRATCRPRRRSTAPSTYAGMEQGSSRSTSAACTSAAACRGARRRSGSSARATARSTTASARRRPARRRVASTASTSPSSGGSMTINTGDIELGPPIGTNTTGQQQEGPLCV